jgi:glycine oxidase
LVSDANFPNPPEGWVGAIEVTGGGRLDTRTFLDESREFFRKAGLYQQSELKEIPASGFILCEGAVGLISGKFGQHRCAKGEILTIKACGWDEFHIRVGAGGWMVPIGQGLFKAGSTYEWNELDEQPTDSGRMRVEEIIHRLGGEDFEIMAHDAGIRPILRRSEPLIGPINDGNWMFNGLGSKGSLYAPGMASRLAHSIIDGIEVEREFDIRHFAGCA